MAGMAAAVVSALACFTATAAALPEGRKYEMVSPSEKGGYGVNFLQAISATGEGVAFVSFGAFAGAPSDPGLIVYFAARGSAGWSTTPLSPPASLAPETSSSGEPFDYSPAMSGAVSYVGLGGNRARSRDATQKRLYTSTPGQPDEASLFTPLGGVLEMVSGAAVKASYAGASADLTKAIISGKGLQASDISGALQLYEVSGTGEPRLVGVDAKGDVLTCQVTLGGATQFHSISADGSEVFFGCGGQLFVRVNGGTTLEVSPHAATFQGASADGSRVFYTDNATGALEMAVVDREAGHEAIVETLPLSSGSSASVLVISGDGSHVYYISQAALAGEGESPASGAKNLYVYDVNRETTGFVADLCSGPGKSGTVPDPRCGSNLNEQSGYLVTVEKPPNQGEWHYPINDSLLWSEQQLQAAQVNECTAADAAQCAGERESGRYLVFSTYAKLTPDDTDTARDVYRYDAQTGRLERVSVGEGGADANGNNAFSEAAVVNELAFFPRAGEFAANANVQYPAFAEATNIHTYEMRTRALSEDGSRIVFSTAAPLSPAALNGQMDVYEWHDGQVHMISSGTATTGDDKPVITPTGGDIFFVTQTSLLPQDGDGLGDVYDARLGGGFPASAAPAARCSQACQGPLTAAPSPLVAGSMSQPAGENLAPPPSTKPNAKLTKALRACGKKPKRSRARCEAQARRRYARAAKRMPARHSARSTRKGAR
jgi:hypothetical protein